MRRDLDVEPGGLRAVRADPVQLGLGPGALLGDGRGRPGQRIGGDVVIDEQLRERGGGVVELPLHRRGRDLELRQLGRATFGFTRGPAAERRPRGGEIMAGAGRDGRRAERDQRVPGRAELRPGALLRGRERVAGPLRRGELGLAARRLRAGLAERVVGGGDGVEEARQAVLAGRIGHDQRGLVEPSLGRRESGARGGGGLRGILVRGPGLALRLRRRCRASSWLR